MELYEKIKTDVAIFLVLFYIVTSIGNYFNLGFDPTDDYENNKRSGLTYYKDHGTGREYLKAGDEIFLRLDTATKD